MTLTYDMRLQQGVYSAFWQLSATGKILVKNPWEIWRRSVIVLRPFVHSTNGMNIRGEPDNIR